MHPTLLSNSSTPSVIDTNICPLDKNSAALKWEQNLQAHLHMKPTSPNFIRMSSSQQKIQVLRGANRYEHSPLTQTHLRGAQTFPHAPRLPLPEGMPLTPLGSLRRGGGRVPHPPTGVRSPPHGAAGPSVSAREEGKRRRRASGGGGRCSSLALPHLLSFSPLPPGRPPPRRSRSHFRSSISPPPFH